MRRSTSLSKLRSRDLDFLDDPLAFRHHTPSSRSVSVARADSLDGARSSRHRHNRDHSDHRRHRRHRHSHYSEDPERRYSYDEVNSYPLPHLRFPARTPGLTFSTAKNFVVLIGNLSAGTPWMQVMDELNGRLLILGTGSTLTPTGEAVLTDETTHQLVTLCRSHTSDRLGDDDVMIVTQNRHGDPLMTAVMPSVSDPRRKHGEVSQYSYDSGMGRVQGYTYGNRPQTWSGSANYVMAQIPNYGSSYGQYGYPWQQGIYGGPYSNLNYYRGGGQLPNVGDLDPGDSRDGLSDRYRAAGVVAEFFPGERLYERGSRHKRNKPLFKLLRSSDGMSEWLQGMDGREMASIRYNVAGQAGFAAQGGASRLFVEAGVDVAMVAAALASRIWIWAETGVTH